MEVALLPSRVASPHAWTISSLQGYVPLFQKVCFSTVILLCTKACQEVGYEASGEKGAGGERGGGLILENCPDGALPYQIGNELCIDNSPLMG